MNLNIYREEKTRVLDLLDEIEELNECLVSSPKLSECPSGTHTPSGLDRLLVRRESVIEELNNASRRALEAMQFVEESISLVEDPNTRIILRLRYVSGKPWKEIAEQTGYNKRTLYRKQAEAMEEIERAVH